MEVIMWLVLTVIAIIGIAKLFIGLMEHDSPEYARQRYKKKMDNDPNVWWEYQEVAPTLSRRYFYIYRFSDLKRYFVSVVKPPDC